MEKQTLIDRCDVAIEDGEGVQSRFIVRIIFRNGLTSTHRLPFEVSVPVYAKFNRQDSPHHWTISSRTLRQLMDHFGPGIEFLDINTDGDHVNFTCFNEKTVSEDGTSAPFYPHSMLLMHPHSGLEEAFANINRCRG